MKKIVKYIAIVSLFLIPVFPLIVANGGLVLPSFFFPYITGKAFYFRMLVEIAFASWIVLAFIDAKYRPRITSLAIGVSVFMLVALIADVLGVNPLRSIWSNFERMEGWLVILHLWMFFITSTAMFGHGEEGHKLWSRWLNVSIGVAFIVGIYGLFQLFGWADIHQGSTRIDASLGNAAYMAVYMLFHSFIAAYLFFARAIKIKKFDYLQWYYAILAIFFSYLLFQTATRGTILGLIGGALLALGLYTLFAKNNHKKYRLVTGITIGVIILIGVLFWINRDAKFIQNSEVLSRLAAISLEENKTQARGYVWPMAIKGWQERPIFGWGQENFNYIFNANYNPEMWPHEQWFDRAHSVFLDWLTASGAVGLLAYISLYIISIIAIWKSTLSIAEKSVLTGLIVGYAIHNVFVFDNLASYAFFFAILGFTGSLKEGKPIKLFGTKAVHLDVVEHVVAPVVIIVLVFGLYFLNVRPLQANVRLLGSLQSCNSAKPEVVTFENALSVNSYMANQEVREQLLSCTGNVVQGSYSDSTKRSFLDLTEKEIKAQIEATPKDARIYTLAGVFMNSIGNFSEAEKYLTEAIKLSPHKQSIVIQLVFAKANLGKNEEALALIKEAYDLTPENPQVKVTYASLFVLTNREAEGRQVLKDQPELFESETIASIYVAIKQYSKAIALYKKLIIQDPGNVQLQGTLAQVQYQAGLINQAIETLRAIAKEHPEYKSGIDAAIKQMQEKK